MSNSVYGWKLWLGLALLAALLLGLTGCRRVGPEQGADIGVNLAFSPDPPQVGQVTVITTLSDSTGQPLIGAQVELEGNMTHAGMAPSLAEAVETAPGRYEAPLELSMAGDWFILSPCPMVANWNVRWMCRE
jgi:hypothetical protein